MNGCIDCEVIRCADRLRTGQQMATADVFVVCMRFRQCAAVHHCWQVLLPGLLVFFSFF